MPATTASARAARPTVAQAYSIAKRLTADQQARLVAKLRRDVWADIQAAAEQVQARMKADGVFITEEEITAEIEVVRAERYAASLG